MHKVGLLSAGAIGVLLLVPFASQAKGPNQVPGQDPQSRSAPRVVPAVSNAVPTVSITLPAVAKKLDPNVKWAVTDPSGTGITGYFLSETAGAPGAGDPGWVANKPATFTFSAGDGLRTLHAWVKAHNGKVSAGAQDTTRIDTTPPTATLVAPVTGTTRTVAVTLGGNDTGGSGITNWAVVLGTTAPSPSDNAWKTAKPTSFQMPLGNTDRTISAFSRDAAGNVSDPASATVTMALPAPTVTVTLPAVTKKLAPVVTIGTTDPGGTGIAAYFLSESATTPLAGDAGWIVSKPATFTFPAGDGTRTLNVWVKDHNGSISAPSQASTLLDTIVPTATLAAPDVTGARAISITVGGTDAGSGITRWAIVAGTTTPGSADVAWKTSPPTTFTLSTGFGVKTISAFTRDAAGNVSAAATRTVTLSPPLPTAAISLPVRTKALAVTVTWSTTDPGGTGLSGYFLSQNATVPALNNANWKPNKPASFTLTAGDGSKTVYAWVKDNNNKVSLTAQASTLLDQTAPTVALTAPSTSTTRLITVSMTGADAGSGITNWALVAGTAVPSATDNAWKSVAPTSFTLAIGNGAKTISAFSRDAAGNVSAASTRSITLTLGPPTVTISMAANTKVSPVPVTITTTDPGGTGIAGFYLSESATAPTVGGAGWVAGKPTTFALSGGDGIKTVHIWVKDVNGSMSSMAQGSTRLDTTVPTVTLTAPASSTSRTISVTIGGSDAGSGITSWALVAGTTMPGQYDTAWKSSAVTSFQLASGNGAKTISAFSRDAAGNVSAAASRTITLAIPAPTATVSIPAITRVTNIGITVPYSDPGGTGINAFLVSENGTTPALNDPNWKPAPHITLSAGDGTKTVYAWVKDNNGTISARAQATTLLDTTLPTVTLTAPATNSGTTVAITVTGSDAGSGITDWAVVEGTSEPSQGGSAWVSSPPTSFVTSMGTGPKTITAFTRDAAGNVSVAATKVVTVQ